MEDGEDGFYTGDVTQVQPFIRVRGHYGDFALLETTILGVLSRGSRVATNVFEVLQIACGKPILFFQLALTASRRRHLTDTRTI